MNALDVPGPVCDILTGAQPVSIGFDWVILPCDGRRPMAVRARLLLKANNRCVGLAYHSEISLYETAEGGFAATVCHVGPLGESIAFRDSFLVQNPAEARRLLQEHQPASYVAFFLGEDLAEAANEALRFSFIWQGLLGALIGSRAPQELQP